jgi:small subunit ribosomal protein S16
LSIYGPIDHIHQGLPRYPLLRQNDGFPVGPFVRSVEEFVVSVRIRMKKLGRSHQAFFRICATDKRAPRDGRVLEELGTYDPRVKDTDARAILKADRVDYWLGVGAQPSERCAVLIKKYGTNGTHVEAQKKALEQMSQPKAVPDPGEPASLPKSKGKKEEPAAEAAPAAEPAVETAEAAASE